MSEYNIYCDESCHLENSQENVIVLGAITCPQVKVLSISRRIRELKRKYNLSPSLEIKWHKVSKSGYSFYGDLIDFFFDHSSIEFRAVLISDKKALDHNKYKQTHDEFYYKIYFELLKVLFQPESKYNIYIDLKDTRGGRKIKKLHDVLCNTFYDWNKDIIKNINQYPSDQIELMQLCDLIIGAISYSNRGLDTNQAKVKLIERIQYRSGYTLDKTTLLRERKMNILRWHSS